MKELSKIMVSLLVVGCVYLFIVGVCSILNKSIEFGLGAGFVAATFWYTYDSLEGEEDSENN